MADVIDGATPVTSATSSIQVHPGNSCANVAGDDPLSSRAEMSQQPRKAFVPGSGHEQRFSCG